MRSRRGTYGCCPCKTQCNGPNIKSDAFLLTQISDHISCCPPSMHAIHRSCCTAYLRRNSISSSSASASYSMSNGLSLGFTGRPFSTRFCRSLQHEQWCSVSTCQQKGPLQSLVGSVTLMSVHALANLISSVLDALNAIC